MASKPTGVYIEGLSLTKDAFTKLSFQCQQDIGREALRALGWALARPMKAATYTTFQRRTGAIQKLLGVHVREQPVDYKLTGYVEEFNVAITGPSPSPFVTMMRRRRNATGKRSVSIRPANAFYWRFLEFGTEPRRATRKPNFLRTGRVARTDKGELRQHRALKRWQASPSRGGIEGRSWLRPVFASMARGSILSCRDSFLKLVEAFANALPKNR